MKEMYYVSYLDNWGKGISRKIRKEIDFFRKNQFNVEYVSLAKNDITKVKKYFFKIMPFFSEYDYQILKNKNKSIIYIRYGKMDFQGLQSLKKLKKFGNIIIMEIPTYPYDGEMQKLDRIFFYKDKIWRNKLKKYVDYIVTYSNDSYIYGIPCINISNFGNCELNSKKVLSENNDINLIAVASLGFWHGYDRLIKGINNYYCSSSVEKRNIIFHLVGDGRELKKYEKMIKEYNLGKHIILYGSKSGEELDKIYDLSDIAIDTLGRHRSNIYYNSTIKGKDYLMKGLPIISGVETELDHDKEYPYYLRVPANNDPIDINDVIEFYDKIYKNKNVYSVIDSIRKYGVENYNVDKCMTPVIKYIRDSLEKKGKGK